MFPDCDIHFTTISNITKQIIWEYYLVDHPLSFPVKNCHATAASKNKSAVIRRSTLGGLDQYTAPNIKYTGDECVSIYKIHIITEMCIDNIDFLDD